MAKLHQGGIKEMRRITRARYNMAVRYNMREDDIIRTTKMTALVKIDTGTGGPTYAG